MLSKEEVFEELEKNSEELDGFGVERLGLFGSFSRGEQDEDSDLDFLVKFRTGEKSYKHFIGLKRFLEDLFGSEVDLVTEESLKPSIEDRVMGEVEYAEEA